MIIIDFISHSATLIVLFALSAFFSSAETALFSLSQIERRRLAQEHPRIGKVVERLLSEPRRTLITILISNNLVNVSAAAVVTLLAISQFGEEGVGVTIALFTLALITFGEIIPKVFAARNDILFSLICAPPLDIMARIFLPLRVIFRTISNFVLSFIIKEKTQTDLISEDELKALVRISEEEGALRKEEERMIRHLIDLGKRPVKQIMIPRPDLIAFDIKNGKEEFIELVKKYHHTHMPVYESDLDHLIGIIVVQEFMLDRQKTLREIIHQPVFIPETKPIDEVLEEFRSNKKEFAICVDEYGGTAGLVTVEDILEEIFGEFYDEYAKTEPVVKKMEGGHLAQAVISLHDLNETLGIRLTSELSETLGGWILERLGRIPKLHESFVFEKFEFQIVEVTKQRILRVLIRKNSK